MARLWLALILLVLRAGAAHAHATLLASEPPDGSVLAAAPTAIVLRFDEAITPIGLRLIGPDGAEILPSAAPVARNSSLSASYPAALPSGSYLLSYRVASADSHPVAGTVAFAIGVGSATALDAAGAQSEMASRWTIPSQVARWLFYLALLASAGGALFRLLIAEMDAALRRSLAIAAVCAIAVGVAQIGLRGALLADLAWSGLWTSEAWQVGTAATLFSSLLVSMVGLLICALALRKDGVRWRVVGAAGAIVAIAGFPLSGHVATVEPRWMTAPAIGAHVLAAAFWIGAFWPLRAALGAPAAPPIQIGSTLRRFSRFAVPAVVLLIASGLLIATVQVVRLAALTQSSYGMLLLIKLTAVAALVCVAGVNRQWLTPAVAAGQPRATQLMRKSIGLEVAISCAILAVTAVLTLTPPPRTIAMAHRVVAAHGDSLHASIDVAPGRPGRNRVVVTLAADIRPKEVWLAMSQAAAGIEPLRRRLTAEGGGAFAYEGAELSIPGRWTTRIEVLLSDFDQQALTADVTIK